MPVATVTSKGQITIPIEVRTALGLRAGDRVQFIQGADGAYEIRPANQSIRALRGALSRYAPGTPVTVEDMGTSIAAAAGGDNQ
ncbi:AbrB/MazE/SpoVT family DNA-binding domain-containing protein [Cellulomonas sp. URHE0023]|uniref:AbrB/MazE/SpoVT family DNA-binding domain-containing protein n=1 Tax=Cellulomonas sp. URHE0023 TaxID=1380354 RepID=UPI00048A2849|nr:AbrB/MazE/SpoVT family DNA-binding domain-containing protein [Cellulomonas sp. URHE0023]